MVVGVSAMVVGFAGGGVSVVARFWWRWDFGGGGRWL